MGTCDSEDRLQDWPQTTRKGNMCFDTDTLQSAAHFYQQALTLALCNYPNDEDFNHSIIAIILSYHNLADLNIQQGNLSDAQFNLHTAHQFILDELNKTGSDLKKMSLLRASNKTQFAIQSFNKDYSTTFLKKEKTQ